MQSIDEKRKQVTIPNPYNIASIDRSLRFIVGGILLGSVFYLSPEAVLSVGSYELMLIKLLPIISVYPLGTAWLGWDPIYHLFHINSSTRVQRDICADIVDQVKVATHKES